MASVIIQNPLESDFVKEITSWPVKGSAAVSKAAILQPVSHNTKQLFQFYFTSRSSFVFGHRYLENTAGAWWEHWVMTFVIGFDVGSHLTVIVILNCIQRLRHILHSRPASCFKSSCGYWTRPAAARKYVATSLLVWFGAFYIFTFTPRGLRDFASPKLQGLPLETEAISEKAAQQLWWTALEMGSFKNQ